MAINQKEIERKVTALRLTGFNLVEDTMDANKLLNKPDAAANGVIFLSTLNALFQDQIPPISTVEMLVKSIEQAHEVKEKNLISLIRNRQPINTLKTAANVLLKDRESRDEAFIFSLKVTAKTLWDLPREKGYTNETTILRVLQKGIKQTIEQRDAISEY